MRILDGSDGPPGRFSSILYRQSASKGCASVVAFTKWKRPEDRLRACLGEGFLIVSSVVARRRAMSVFLVALTLAAAQSATKAWAAGAFAIGKCGAYGQAFDYAGEADALAAARKQCNGECPTTFTVKRACAAFSVDMTNPCGTWLRGQAAHFELAEPGDARMLQIRRQGMRDPRLGLRREGIAIPSTAAASKLGSSRFFLTG
jgi:hypothetical protein